MPGLPLGEPEPRAEKHRFILSEERLGHDKLDHTAGTEHQAQGQTPLGKQVLPGVEGSRDDDVRIRDDP
jgi:hypothetical protein